MRFRKLRIAWSAFWGTISLGMLVVGVQEVLSGYGDSTSPFMFLVGLSAAFAIIPMKGIGFRFTL